ncbi:hypothetical protein QFC19_003970 [Naganishia cerealis]|uniref:Uncharacterized protein n=1 Tax=Naganishia cerealis TaxID=610337 RepID=A0ACC2VZ04_9TREE|nr:hypothetical protein QFC19_003970 [Naganishia cerealis]
MASLLLSDIIDIRELINSVFAFDPTPTPALAPVTPPFWSPCTSPTTPDPPSSTSDASLPVLPNDDDHRFRVDCTGADGLFLMDWYTSIDEDNAQQQPMSAAASAQPQHVFAKPTTNGTTDSGTATASTTTKGDTDAPASTTNNNNLPAVLHRPPIRPTVPGVSKSKFDLELNPFEQSFSRSSTSIHPHNNNGKTHTGSSSEDVRGAYDNWNAKQRAASAAAPGGDAAKTGTEGEDDRRKSDPLQSKMSLSSSSSPGDKTVLPPLSALTSPVPVDPASHFSWAGISSFLRAGPLSPAMLNGPTSTSGNNHHLPHSSHHPPTGLTPGGGFDPSTFRTGFTPGGILSGLGGSNGGVIGSGSGFTPGYAGLLSAGGGFPMPSPNTAAFLSMVTHGTPGPGTPTGGAPGGGRNADIQSLGGQNGKLASGSSSRTLVNGTVEHGGPGGLDAAGRVAVNGDVRRTSGDVGADVGGGSMHTMHPGSQQHQHPQVNMTPNSLNVLTGVINHMNSNNTDEDGMYSTTATRSQNSLTHQSSHGGATGQADSDTAHHLPPPPPHPDHPMHSATDYFVNATGVQPAGIGASNNGGVPSHMHSAHPGLAGHMQPRTINSSHLNHHQQQQQQQQQMSLPPAHLHASSTDPRGGYSMHHPGGATMANVNPQGGVAGAGVGPGGPLNGLFLLSQAHQELGKREEAQRVAGGASVDGLGSDATTRPRVTSTGTTSSRGNKRKSEDGGKQGAGGRSGGSKRSKKNSIGTIHDQQQQNGINVPAYHGQSILQQSQALLAQGLQAQAERDAMQEPADDDEDHKMNDHGRDGGDGDGMGKKDGKPETEEEKRKNFLERNRQAALKCRQRKKAWLTQLQTKVDGLTEENERLKAMLTSITDEAQKLSAVLSSHRDCPGMAASMAQLGLTLPQMPMPPPHPGVGVGGMPVGHMVQQRQMSVVPNFVPPQPH